MLAHIALLVIAFQAPVPDISLTVPDKPVPFARLIKMKVVLPPKGPAPNDYQSVSVDWDVTEIAKRDSPLEDDLEVDSNTLKASIPSGLNDTTVKIRVAVTFVYTDFSTRVARANKNVIVGKSTPGPGPGPTPVDPTPPVPVDPTPPVPVDPTPPPPVAEIYGLTTWTVTQLNTTKLDKTQAKALAAAFHQIAGMARNGAYSDRAATIAAMAERNRNALGTNIQVWIDGYLQPLQTKINPLNPKIKTVTDQAALFDEIGSGLDIYGGSK